MKRKAMLLFIVAALALTGCGNGAATESSAYNKAADSSDSWSEGFDGYETSEDGMAETGQEASGQYEQKLIRTYSYTFETLEFDSSMQFIDQKVSEYGGYIESSETSGSTNRHAYLTIRIPEQKCDAFLNEAGSIGEIIYKSSSSEDITLNYYDTAAKLESLNTQRERLLELLENAASLDDVVSLEQHLSDVEYEINRYTTMLKVYDNKVDYVTISFTINEVQQIQVVEDDSFLTQIKKGLAGNTSAVINGLMDFVIFLITGIPYFIIIGIVVVIVVWIVKKVKKSKAKKRAAEPYNAGAGCYMPPYGMPQGGAAQQQTTAPQQATAPQRQTTAPQQATAPQQQTTPQDGATPQQDVAPQTGSPDNKK